MYELKQVCKVIGSMENDPLYILVQDNSRGEPVLCELFNIYSFLTELIEIDTRTEEQIL